MSNPTADVATQNLDGALCKYRATYILGVDACLVAGFLQSFTPNTKRRLARAIAAALPAPEDEHLSAPPRAEPHPDAPVNV